MSNLADLEEILSLLTKHAAWLLSDVELAATREEHVRLTARANEAETITDHVKKLLLKEHG